MKKIYKVAIIILLLISISSIFLTNTILANKEFSKKNIATLKESLKDVLKVGDEYADFPEALNINSDLYSTYYSYKCLKMLGDKPLDKVLSEELKTWVTNLKVDNIKNSTNENYIYEIYFYSELMNILDVKLNNDDKNRLISSIEEYQAKNNIKMIDSTIELTMDNAFQTLSNTYYYLKILDNVGHTNNFTDKTSAYVEKVISSKILEDADLNKMSIFKLLVDVCNLTDYNLNNNTYFSSTLLKCNAYFEKYLNNLNQIPVLHITQWIDLNKAMSNTKYIEKYNKDISDYFMSLQNNNGMFPLMYSEEPNILTTYVILQYFDENSVNIQNKDVLIENLLKNRARDNGFYEFVQTIGDLKSTYYFYSISNLIGYNDRLQIHKDYLVNNNINEYTLYYLLKMDKDVSNINVSDVVKKIQEADYKKLLNSNAYDIVIMNLSILNILKIELNSDNKNEITSFMESSNNSYDEKYKMIKYCLEIQILSLLNISDGDIVKSKKDYIIGTLNNNFEIIEEDFRLFCIYNSFLALNDSEIDNKLKYNTKKRIVDYIFKCKDKYECFALNKDSGRSLEGTVYSLFILNKLKKIDI